VVRLAEATAASRSGTVAGDSGRRARVTPAGQSLRSAPRVSPRCASGGAVGRVDLCGVPGMSQAGLDVVADQPPNHLGRRDILRGAEVFEDLLLPGID
jgi:hypothetical protein